MAARHASVVISECARFRWRSPGELRPHLLSNLEGGFRSMAPLGRHPWVLRGIVLAAVVVMAATAFLAMRQASRAVELPIGCDDFGYLRQARLFREAGFVQGLNTAITDDLTVSL